MPRSMLTRPRSFRLKPSTIKALDEVAERFRMTRTSCLEFLIEAANSKKQTSISMDGSRLSIEFQNGRMET